MFYKIENGKFVGFYEDKDKDKDGNYTEITLEDWQMVLDKQSQGEVIFYNPKSKKLDTLKLQTYETIENGKIVFNREKRIEEIRKELYELRLEYDVKPFDFEVEGVTYLQNNRSIDQSNLTRIVVMCQATKKTTFDNWKFYTKDNSEKYVSVSLTNMMKMAEIMQEQTTKSMATETLLSHNLENLTEEELKNYNVKERYEKAYGEMS